MVYSSNGGRTSLGLWDRTKGSVSAGATTTTASTSSAAATPSTPTSPMARVTLTSNPPERYDDDSSSQWETQNLHTLVEYPPRKLLDSMGTNQQQTGTTWFWSRSGGGVAGSSKSAASTDSSAPATTKMIPFTMPSHPFANRGTATQPSTAATALAIGTVPATTTTTTASSSTAAASSTTGILRQKLTQVFSRTGEQQQPIDCTTTTPHCTNQQKQLEAPAEGEREEHTRTLAVTTASASSPSANSGGTATNAHGVSSLLPPTGLLQFYKGSSSSNHQEREIQLLKEENAMLRDQVRILRETLQERDMSLLRMTDGANDVRVAVTADGTSTNAPGSTTTATTTTTTATTTTTTTATGSTTTAEHFDQPMIQLPAMDGMDLVASREEIKRLQLDLTSALETIHRLENEVSQQRCMELMNKGGAVSTNDSVDSSPALKLSSSSESSSSSPNIKDIVVQTMP